MLNVYADLLAAAEHFLEQTKELGDPLEGVKIGYTLAMLERSVDSARSLTISGNKKAEFEAMYKREEQFRKNAKQYVLALPQDKLKEILKILPDPPYSGQIGMAIYNQLKPTKKQ